MHMLFVDESGDPGYPKDGNRGKWGATKFFVRVGPVIHGWKSQGNRRTGGVDWTSELQHKAAK